METIQASYTGIFCWWSSDAAWSKGLISTERVCNGGKVGLEDMLSKVSSLFLSSPEKINYWIRLYLSEVLLMKLSFFENLYALLLLLLRPLSEWLSVNWVFCVIITGSSKTYCIQISLRKCYIYFFFFLLFLVLNSLQRSCQMSCLPHPSGTLILGNRKLFSNVLDSKRRKLQTVHVFASHLLLLWGGVN